MGQKTHPIGVRLGIIQKTRSIWYAKKSEYALFIKEDHHLRNYVIQTRNNCGISSIEIERRGYGVRVRISSAQIIPFVGKEGSSLEKLRRELQLECKKIRLNYFKLFGLLKDENLIEKFEIQIFLRQLDCPESDARCIANFIAMEVEKRVPFRRVLRLAQDRSIKLGKVRGLRIQISGRLNGAEIARTEWVRSGRVPLHTLSADLDYSRRAAHTIYGLLGIKVWIFRPA